jgi:hypothetical protein
MIINFRQMNDYALMAYYMNYFAEKKTKELELIKLHKDDIPSLINSISQCNDIVYQAVRNIDDHPIPPVYCQYSNNLFQSAERHILKVKWDYLAHINVLTHRKKSLINILFRRSIKRTLDTINFSSDAQQLLFEFLGL